MRIWLTWLALVALVTGASVKLRWNANAADEEVTFYQVKAQEVWGVHEVAAKTPNTELVLADLKAGVPYFFSVRAENAGGVSDYSEPIVAMPLPRYKVTIQKSSSLGVWEDTTTVLTGPAHGVEFFRLKIELDDYQGGEP